MRLSRAECIVLGLLAVLVLAGAASWIGAVLIAQSVSTDGAAGGERLRWAVFLMKSVAVVLAASVLIGLGWLYPAFRRDAHERGRLARASESYMQAALTDPLTGLQNRRYFDDALREYLREFALIDRPLGVLMLDLDHFKPLNDTYGHDNGDRVLRAVAQCLQEHTRYHDVLARIGGEEFAIIVPNSSLVGLERFAERIRQAVAETPILIDGEAVTVTTSIGIAEWDGQEDGEALIKRADRHLYGAKAAGRNRVGSTPSPLPPKVRSAIFGTG